jgi:hypothetical protein
MILTGERLLFGKAFQWIECLEYWITDGDLANTGIDMINPMTD